LHLKDKDHLRLTDKDHPALIVIAGPAGSGKSTLCDRLVAEDPSFSRVVTTTTRAPRAGETNGVHYHFFSPEEFEARKQRGEFLETAFIHGKAGEPDRQYGTLKSSVFLPLQDGKNLVMHIDTQGVEAFRAYALQNEFFARSLHTVFVWAHVPVLIERMRNRYAFDHRIRVDQITPEQDAEIARRIISAEKEILEMAKFDIQIESRSKDEDFQRLVAAVQAHQASLTLKLSAR
jgi:guanylate kinase